MTGSCKLSTTQILSAIIVIIIIGAFTAYAYSNANDALKDSVKQGMKSTAGVMATQINASDIAKFKPGDDTSPAYLATTRQLRNMRSMNDHILNAYILKVSPDRTITFLVDDLAEYDPQGSAKIGEVSTAPDKLEIFSALSAPTTSREPYTTKYGSFISAYAPIDDSNVGSSGNTYAVLAIDMAADDYNNYTSRGILIVLTGIVSMIIAVGAIFWFGRRDEKKSE
ncbi:hypothetical protein [uncultured Methanoregula sp.]|uniref:hypothetical protein n=1 Tax=uncultured Methanoregula sp. TaxID=1005933 RepID=UPI002AAAA3BF|nr:hypothetical protein [uncultured Methanoregula sp.]